MTLDNETFFKLIAEKEKASKKINPNKINYLLGDVDVCNIDFTNNLAVYLCKKANLPPAQLLYKTMEFMPEYQNYPIEYVEMLARKQLNMPLPEKAIRRRRREFRKQINLEKWQDYRQDILDRRKARKERKKMHKVPGHYVIQF
tara:strand:- start:159 stop:590 length:432 start_codon:yes stop_codon:yes gene_type:complete